MTGSFFSFTKLLFCIDCCSPSVLDRLNGLLEPNGVLKIDEQGTVDGKVPTVTPHPDFRYLAVQFFIPANIIPHCISRLGIQFERKILQTNSWERKQLTCLHTLP